MKSPFSHGKCPSKMEALALAGGGQSTERASAPGGDKWQVATTVSSNVDEENSVKI